MKTGIFEKRLILTRNPFRSIALTFTPEVVCLLLYVDWIPNVDLNLVSMARHEPVILLVVYKEAISMMLEFVNSNPWRLDYSLCAAVELHHPL